MKWKVSDPITDNAKKELNNFGDIISQLLFNRGIKTSDAAIKYFNTDLSLLNDYSKITDIYKAANIVLSAVKERKKIFIYGDYDADGICATSIMFNFLFRRLNAKVLPYIPSRFDEGYGLNTQGLDEIINQGGELVITVDCGIRDAELVKQYTEKGLDFIITDHHTLPLSSEGQKTYPESALAVIHPDMPDTEYPFSGICGTTVVWKLIQAISEKAEIEDKDFSPNEYLDLVALATVCDVMPLIDENRVIVSNGIKQMMNTTNIGLRALLIRLGIELMDIQTYHFGFVIGPRLNASGRVSHALDAVRLLSSQNQSQVEKVVSHLEELNNHRQDLTVELLKQAEEQIEKDGQENNLLFVAGEEWSEGVVGLVASRLCEKYHKPVLVGSKKGDEITGSARSISSFNVTTAISNSEDILIRFGGHSQAAGFTLKADRYEEFKRSIIEFANKTLTISDLEAELLIDLEIELKDATIELVNEIKSFEPLGMGNRTPVFMISKLKVLSKKLVGRDQNHLKLKLQKDDSIIEAIGFNIGQRFSDLKQNATIDIVGSLDINEWNGNSSVQLKIKDIKDEID